MYINNNYINPPNEIIDINKFPNYYEENEFIYNLRNIGLYDTEMTKMELRYVPD